MPTDFHYVPTSGDLSGKSFEEQTERAFNELGAQIDSIELGSSSALQSASQALTIANQAALQAGNAEAAAQGAVQQVSQLNADVSSLDSRVNLAEQTAAGAYDMAAVADSNATQAISIATQADEKADEALTDSSQALDTATTALNTANSALLAVNRGNGAFTSTSEIIDADDYIAPNNLYVLNSGSLNFPIATPLYFEIKTNDFQTTATQMIWNEGESAVLNRYMRLAVVEQNLNAGSEVFNFTANADVSSVDGELTVSANSNVLDASFAPGSFVAERNIGAHLSGTLSFALDSFTDGVVTVNSIDLIQVKNSSVYLLTNTIGGNNAYLNVRNITMSSNQIEIGLTITWTDIRQPTVTWAPWRMAGSDRIAYNTSVTLYLSPSGSDSNDGLSEDAPFATWEAVVSLLRSIDVRGHAININVSAGNYPGQRFILTSGCEAGSSVINLIGPGSGAATLTTTTSAEEYIFSCVSLGVVVNIYGNFTIVNSSSGSSFHNASSVVNYRSGTLTLSTARLGMVVELGGYTRFYSGTGIVFSGTFMFCVQVSNNGVMHLNASNINYQSVTVSSANLYSTHSSGISLGAATISGSVTGTRYAVRSLSIIDTNGGGANFIPGTAAGSAASGGVYV